MKIFVKMNIVELFYIIGECWLFFWWVDFMFKFLIEIFFFVFFDGVCEFVFNWMWFFGSDEVCRDLVFDVWLCGIGCEEEGRDLLLDVWLCVFGFEVIGGVLVVDVWLLVFINLF